MAQSNFYTFERIKSTRPTKNEEWVETSEKREKKSRNRNIERKEKYSHKYDNFE